MVPMALIRPRPISPMPILRSRSPKPTSMSATPVTMMISMVFVFGGIAFSCSPRPGPRALPLLSMIDRPAGDAAQSMKARLRQIKRRVMNGLRPRNGLLRDAAARRQQQGRRSAKTKKPTARAGFLLCVFFPWTPTTAGLAQALSFKGLWWVVLGSNQ
ncbi:hypothetical protein D9M68_883730 [compost metagenome]